VRLSARGTAVKIVPADLSEPIAPADRAVSEIAIEARGAVLDADSGSILDAD
jgi:hypothetical protein